MPQLRLQVAIEFASLPSHVVHRGGTTRQRDIRRRPRRCSVRQIRRIFWHLERRVDSSPFSALNSCYATTKQTKGISIHKIAKYVNNVKTTITNFSQASGMNFGNFVTARGAVPYERGNLLQHCFCLPYSEIASYSLAGLKPTPSVWNWWGEACVKNVRGLWSEYIGTGQQNIPLLTPKMSPLGDGRVLVYRDKT